MAWLVYCKICGGVKFQERVQVSGDGMMIPCTCASGQKTLHRFVPTESFYGSMPDKPKAKEGST